MTIKIQLPIVLLLLTFSLNQPALAGQPGGVILQYHHIGTLTPAITSIEPAQFKRHMDYIAQQGYQVWALERLVAALISGQPLPENVVSITFDDAYPSIYHHGFPILKAYGWPFSIFVSTYYIRQQNDASDLNGDAIINGGQPDADDRNTANDSQYLSWSQLREMRQAGASILNHTHSHPHLLRRLSGETRADWEIRISYQINRAQQLLTEHLGPTPKLLAYPYGEYDETVTRIATKLGYVGIGQQSGAAGPLSDLSALPRYPLSGIYSDMEGLQLKLNTWPLPLIANGRDPLLHPAENRPILDLQFNDPNLPLDNLVCYGPNGATKLTQLGPQHYQAQSETPLNVGRSRYNCTLPVPGSSRFYWFSQLWILRHPDGSWYAED
ncbi:polysaccharide deacetylase family protein [Pseudomonadales bacterium]|nr:polysaccharide deacetylase family protein [Pseudomonadales bacterium]MDB9942958.1 polysaccharide deacetylase family protein [Pseudomonadales bacterium]MDC1306817.1 polysaccharide deacetylase family protein [Pseudomonadales bacterium]